MDKENKASDGKASKESSSTNTSQTDDKNVNQEDSAHVSNDAPAEKEPFSPHHAHTNNDGTLMDDTLQDVNDLQDVAAAGSKLAHMGQGRAGASDAETPADESTTEGSGQDAGSSAAADDHGVSADETGQSEASAGDSDQTQQGLSNDQEGKEAFPHDQEDSGSAQKEGSAQNEPGASAEGASAQSSTGQSTDNENGAAAGSSDNQNDDSSKDQSESEGKTASGDNASENSQGSGEKKDENAGDGKNESDKENKDGKTDSSESKDGKKDSDAPQGEKAGTAGKQDQKLSGGPGKTTGKDSAQKNAGDKSPQSSGSKAKGQGNPNAEAGMSGKGGGRRGGMNFNKDTAQKAASLGKSAGAAATGNPLVAAYQASKAGSGLTKAAAAFLIGTLIFLGSLTSLFLYALPTSIFEFAETYTKDYYAEKYEAAVFGSEGEIHWAKFVEGIKIGGEIAGDVIEALGDTLKEFITTHIPFFSSSNTDNKSEDIESYSADGEELKVTQLEAAEKSTLEDKIEATQKKVKVRSEDIEDAVRNISKGDNSEIAKAVKEYYNSNGEYDEFKVNTSVKRYGLSKEGAIAVMGLYMVQEGGSLDDVRLSSLLKWLGYYDGTESERLDFKVLGVDCHVKTWQGTFLPQYLHEQKHQEETKYKTAKTTFEDYQTAAADLILEVDIPEMEDITVQSYEHKEEDGSIKRVGIATVNIKVQPRELEEIADIMGMWIGDLTKRQEYMPSNLSVNMIDKGGAGPYGTGSYEWLEGGELIEYTPYHDLYSDFIGIHGQCTWYAADRLYQLYMETDGELGADLTGLHMGNGGDWAANARAYGYKVDNVAEAGKAACFVPGITQNHPGDAWQPFDAYAGHIAIVEKVNPDGSIIVSEFWGHYVTYEVKFSYFTAETAATIQYIDFTVKS